MNEDEMDYCPNCKSTPLIIYWPSGTLDFSCDVCGLELEPTAKTLISLLPIKA